MGCKVTYIPLGELAKFESGGTPSKKEESYWNGAIPWISAKTLVGDAVCKSDLCITKQGLDAGSKLAPKGSLLLLTRGSGLFKRIPLAIVEKDVAYNQDIKCIEATAEGISNRYLFYTLKALEPAISAMLETTGIGAGKLATDRLKALRIPVLDEAARLRVTYIADCINGKLSLNTKLNGYLEELLLAKYDKLFPANADFTGILPDVGTVIGGATPSKKRSEYYCSNGIGWITPRDLSNTSDKFIAHGADDITDEGYASCSAKLLPKGSVLFSSRAPIGYVAIATNEVATNQGFKSVVPKEEIGTAFVYCFLVRNKQRIADMGAGTTFPEVSGKMMKSVELAVPEQSLCAEFDVFAEPILKQQETLERENRDLAALRNALLPKLMSGEIDVSKVDLTQLNSHLA